MTLPDTKDGATVLDALMTEAEFRSQVVAIARLLGWYVYFVPDSRRTEAGYPDLTMVHPTQRRLMFIELKSEKGKINEKRSVTKKGRVMPSQADWIQALTNLGLDTDRIETHVWRPHDWDYLNTILKEA